MPDLDQQQYLSVLQRKLKHALRSREMGEATDLLELITQESPLSCITRGLELEVKLTSGQLDEALILAKQLVIDFPGSARIHYLSGKAFYQSKKYSHALANLSESHRLHNHWQTRRLIGKTYTQLGDYSRAESELLALVSDHHVVDRDLAWLYERMGEFNRALQYTERVLEIWPQDRIIQDQALRLKACLMDTEMLECELAALQALDEEVPEVLLISSVTNLLASGQGVRARQIVTQNLDNLTNKTVTQIGWNCYKTHAYDLVLALFLKALPEHLSDVKYLTTLETAAKKCHRLNEVVEQYQLWTEQNKQLYGRIKRLQNIKQ